MYQAALFDMDGVVADTQESVRAFWQRLAQSEGYSLSARDLRQHVYGHRADHTLRALFPQISPDRYARIYEQLRQDQESLTYTAIPGVLTLLEQLNRAHVPVALVTGAQDWKAAAIISQLNLTATFDTTVCANDVPRGKPDPACYLEASERLSADITKCLVFEDAIPGVTAAVAAGADCVAIAGPDGARLVLAAGALTVVRDFEEISFGPDGRVLRIAGKREFPFSPAREGRPAAVR